MKPGDGSMAQYCLIEEVSALVLPAEIESDLAAALGLSAIAAWMALTWRGRLQPGEQVLVLGLVAPSDRWQYRRPSCLELAV